MNIQVVSDIHCEHMADNGKTFIAEMDPTEVDVLVLPGDIVNAVDFVRPITAICKKYKNAHVVYVHGNHEFYDSDRDSVVKLTQQAMKKNSNLVWLDCTLKVINGQRFLGAPLWFSYDDRIPDTYQYLSDFNLINDYETWVYRENKRAKEFFENNLKEGDIVVTHHLPSYRCVHPTYMCNSLNHFFVSDVSYLIEERKPKYWFYGHSHKSNVTRIGDTTLVCNPCGYLFQPNVSFQEKLILF